MDKINKEQIIQDFKTLEASFSNNNNGHKYLMIKNGQMYLTENRKERSSLSEINKFVDEAFSKGSFSNEEKLAILSSYHTVTKNFKHKELTGIRKMFFKNKKETQIQENKAKFSDLSKKISKHNGNYKFDLKSQQEVETLVSLLKHNSNISNQNTEITIQSDENIEIDKLVEIICSKQTISDISITQVSLKINDDPLIIKNHVVEFKNIKTFYKYCDKLNDILSLQGIFIDKLIEDKKDIEKILQKSNNSEKKFYIRCKPGLIKENIEILKNKENLYLNGVSPPIQTKHLDPELFLKELLLFQKEEMQPSDEYSFYSPDELLKYIIVQGGDCELKKKVGNNEIIKTPLTLLALFDNDILNVAIDNASSLNVKDTFGNTPLLWAIANAEYSNADRLVQKIDPKDLNIVNDGRLAGNEITPMHLLVMKGRPNPTSNLGKNNPNITLNLLEALLKKGVALEKDVTDRDAFDYALEKQDFEMIKLFAQYVDPEIVKEKFEKHLSKINDLLNPELSLDKEEHINNLLQDLGIRSGNKLDHNYKRSDQYHDVFFLDTKQAFSDKNLNQIKEFMKEKLK